MKNFQRDRLWVIWVILICWMPYFMGAWDKTLPADDTVWNVADNNIRDNWAYLETMIDVEHDFTTGKHTDVTVSGTLITQGIMTGGANGTVQGRMILWDGAAGNTPAYIQLHAPAGESWFVFVEDDGTLKVDDVAPTANGDGDVVGAQT